MFFLVFVLFTSRWSVRKVLDCFYFPSVSETASLSSNWHLSAKNNRIARFYRASANLGKKRERSCLFMYVFLSKVLLDSICEILYKNRYG